MYLKPERELPLFLADESSRMLLLIWRSKLNCGNTGTAEKNTGYHS